MGFRSTDSVVAVGIGWTYISSVGEAQRNYPAHCLMRDYMRPLVCLGSGATVVLDPTVDALLKDTQGFLTKAARSQWFSENIEKQSGAFSQTVSRPARGIGCTCEKSGHF